MEEQAGAEVGGEAEAAGGQVELGGVGGGGPGAVVQPSQSRTDSGDADTTTVVERQLRERPGFGLRRAAGRDLERQQLDLDLAADEQRRGIEVRVPRPGPEVQPLSGDPNLVAGPDPLTEDDVDGTEERIGRPHAVAVAQGDVQRAGHGPGEDDGAVGAGAAPGRRARCRTRGRGCRRRRARPAAGRGRRWAPRPAGGRWVAGGRPGAPGRRRSAAAAADDNAAVVIASANAPATGRGARRRPPAA